MLTYLHVKNFALIHELTIEFEKGLSVLTGETGAGKSILIGSMNAISGNKLDKGIIRRGQDYALIEMQFEMNRDKIAYFGEQFGVPVTEDNTIILSRKYKTSGRSIYRANGCAVTGQVMREVFDAAIDIHSQHEHQSLLNPRTHMELLDQYIGEVMWGEKLQLKELYHNYKNHMRQLNEDHLNDEHRLREMDFLAFEIKEMEAADLQIGEDASLQKAYKRLDNRKKIQDVLRQVDYLMSENAAASISDQTAMMIQELSKVSQLDQGLEDLKEEALQVESMMHDFARNVDHYRESMVQENEGDLEELSQRIHIVNSLKNKYSNTIEGILTSLTDKQKQLEELQNYDANIAKIKAEILLFETEIKALCHNLSLQRQSAAKVIAGEIEAVLHDLNFNNCQVEVRVDETESFSANGNNTVTILISTNMNEPVQPLNKIASGGELSRVMLALKSVFAEMDQLDTLVFDEIDSGISGRTAQMVAEKMVYLSKRRQIICISHLPQIAAMADIHYLIDKIESEDHVETTISRLIEDEVHNELTRLIGGASITGATLQAAKEMKEQATALKGNDKS